MTVHPPSPPPVRPLRPGSAPASALPAAGRVPPAAVRPAGRRSRLMAVMAILLPAGVLACSRDAADRTATDRTATDDARPSVTERGGAVHDSLAPGATPAACAADAGLTLPAGFCAVVFADDLGAPRHVVVREDGTVFTVRRTGPNGQAGVVALRDTSGDGRADVRELFGPLGGTGIRLDGGHLFVDAKRSILRYPLPATAMRPAGAPDTIVSGLPTGGHDAHNFVIDGAGGLIVNFGSLTNSCQQKDRGNESPGVDPCVERESRAGLWRFSATRAGQKVADGERHAAGIRNSVALELAPDGKLWVAQHGRDQLFQNWPGLYDRKQSAENPGEELLQVERNDDFGWPYCYYDVNQKKMVLAPEYGGDGGKAVGRCSGVKSAVASFPAHWAPMALLFYTGSQFPARYREGVFIAFHGSWNRAPEPQGGYNVVFQPMRGGRPSGPYEQFATGFAGATMTPSGAAHRPAGLAQGPDGAIYVSDDKGGRIYRLTYQGR